MRDRPGVETAETEPVAEDTTSPVNLHHADGFMHRAVGQELHRLTQDGYRKGFRQQSIL